MEHWEPILAYASAVATVVAYFITRNRESQWKRTEFLFQLGQYLDTDPAIQSAVLILEGRNPAVGMADVFGETSTLSKQERGRKQQDIDALLNFLERIAHAVYTLKTLSLDEVLCFGWYLLKVRDTELLAGYCSSNGFEDVLKLAGDVDALLNERQMADPAASETSRR